MSLTDETVAIAACDRGHRPPDDTTTIQQAAATPAIDDAPETLPIGPNEPHSWPPNDPLDEWAPIRAAIARSRLLQQGADAAAAAELMKLRLTSAQPANPTTADGIPVLQRSPGIVLELVPGEIDYGPEVRRLSKRAGDPAWNWDWLTSTQPPPAPIPSRPQTGGVQERLDRHNRQFDQYVPTCECSAAMSSAPCIFCRSSSLAAADRAGHRLLFFANWYQFQYGVGGDMAGDDDAARADTLLAAVHQKGKASRCRRRASKPPKFVETTLQRLLRYQVADQPADLLK